MREDTIAATVDRLVALAPAYFRFSPDWALKVYFPVYTEEHYEPLNWISCGRVSNYSPQHDPQAWSLLHAGLLRLATEELGGGCLVIDRPLAGPATYKALVYAPQKDKVFPATGSDATTALLCAVVGALEAQAAA